MKLRCFLCIFLTLLVGFTVLAGCKRQKREHTLRLELGTNSEPDTLNPLFAEMAASGEVYTLGHRSLTMYNDKWELVPGLANEVPSVKNGQVKLLPSKKMVVTWNIREDAAWEDGVPVTADDFIFTWKVCLDPGQEIIDRDTCERVESMVAAGADKKTLVVTWKKPFAFFSTYRVHELLPAHILQPRYLKPGGGTNDLKKDPYGQKPLSCGPFRFKEWVPGQYITYVRNEKFSPRPFFEEITFRIIPNTQSMESNLIAGNIAGTTTAGGFTVAQIEAIKKREGDRFRYYSVPGMVWAHIDFNMDNPWLADVRVRKALAHAVNRQKIIDSIYHGKYTLANSFLPPKHWGYDNSMPMIPFDLKKAASLLDEAGWKQANPGEVRQNKKGEKLVLKISAVAGIKDIEQMQQVFQSDLRSIGVGLEIDNKPAKVFFGDIARHRKFPHLSFYSWVSDPGSWAQTLWHKNYIPTPKNQWQGQNYPGWKNDEASKILDEIPTILDEAERKKLMKRVQELWLEALPAIPMYFRPEVAITKPGLKNYKPTGTQTPVTWNAWEWSY